MKALGFDPGSKHIGWAYYDGDWAEWGIWEAPIIDSLKKLIERTSPDIIGIEQLELHSDKFRDTGRAKHIYLTSIKVSSICSQIETVAYLYDIPILFRTKSEINHELGGYISIKKSGMQKLIQIYLELPQPIRPQHANDAMAVAIIAYNHYRRTRNEQLFQD